MTYELINKKTTNTFGDYGSEREALDAYEKIQAHNAQLAEELILVAFDDNGEAVKSHKPSELFV